MRVVKSIRFCISKVISPDFPVINNRSSVSDNSTNSKNPMPKSRRLLMLALALAAGAAPLVQSIAAGDDFVTLCYKTRTIQVPFYLRFRYIGAGAMDGPCTASSQ